MTKLVQCASAVLGPLFSKIVQVCSTTSSSNSEYSSCGGALSLLLQHENAAGLCRAAVKAIVPEEADYIASRMRKIAKSFAGVAPEVADGAEALAARLVAKSPMPLHEYFADQSEVYQDLSTAFMRSLQLHQRMTPEQRRQAPVQISDEEWLTKGQRFAMAAAACGLLVGFFTHRPAGDDRPRLISK